MPIGACCCGGEQSTDASMERYSKGDSDCPQYLEKFHLGGCFENQIEFCGEQNGVGCIQPDHPRHHGFEVGSCENVKEALHMSKVEPDGEQCHEERNESSEERDSPQSLQRLYVKYINEGRQQEGAGGEADEPDIGADP